MKKKKKLSFTLVMVTILLSAAYAHADEMNDAVYVWVNGESTCYQLSAMPVVTYKDGYAVLTINSNEDVLTLELTDGAKMITTFGVYNEPQVDPTEVKEFEEQPVKKVSKYIIGGRVIIVKDEMKFDIEGKRVIDY